MRPCRKGAGDEGTVGLGVIRSDRGPLEAEVVADDARAGEEVGDAEAGEGRRGEGGLGRLGQPVEELELGADVV